MPARASWAGRTALSEPAGRAQERYQLKIACPRPCPRAACVGTATGRGGAIAALAPRTSIRAARTADVRVEVLVRLTGRRSELCLCRPLSKTDVFAQSVIGSELTHPERR